MFKKISLLLAFLGRPALITLDEPLVTLDAAGAAALFDLVRERHYQDGTGFILSSHQPGLDLEIPDMRDLILLDESIKLI
jgi:ABC-2 type transport system ATP-binding protein